MAGPTINQRVHGYLWHWHTGPGWVRDGSQIAKLRNAVRPGVGMRVLKVQLQDDTAEHGAILTPEQTKEWRDAGMKVFGMVRPSGPPLAAQGNTTAWDPWEAAQWMRSERVRLGLAGFDFNGEAETNTADRETGGEWSLTAATQIRNLHPNLPINFDSYWGPMGDKINLGAWQQAAGASFWVQTFWGDMGLWDDPMTNIVRKGLGAQPKIAKNILKPIFRVAPNDAGQLPNWDVAFTDTKVAGTKGVGFYYIDGIPDFELLLDLTRRAISSGCAY